MSEICEICKKKYGEDFPIANTEASKCWLYLLSLFDNSYNDTIKLYGTDIVFDNTLSK